MQEDGQAKDLPRRGSLLIDLLARAIALCVLAVAGFVVWIWLSGPLKLEASALPFPVPNVSPLTWLPALGAAWCVLRWRRLPALIGLRAGQRLRIRGVHPLAWPVMALSIALLGSQLWTITFEATTIPHKLRKTRRIGPAEMAVNAANRHAGPLVRTLVRREDPGPVVIWINDLDTRGHTVSFYLYPRLLLMEPRQRRWSLRSRMTGVGGYNPLWQVGLRPRLDRSEAFAEERGRPFIVAGREGGGAQ